MKEACCEDCSLPYQDFGADTTLSNEQWSMIHPESEEGLLCANCIVKRASSLSGIIAARMELEFGHDPEYRVRHMSSVSELLKKDGEKGP